MKKIFNLDRFMIASLKAFVTKVLLLSLNILILRSTYMFRTLQNVSSDSLFVEPLMLSNLAFKTMLKHSRSKFLKDPCISFSLEDP